MGYNIMSDVNEFNAVTGEAVIRPFTSDELALASIEPDDSIVKSVPTEDYAQKQAAVASLVAVGLTEAQARSIVGI